MNNKLIYIVAGASLLIGGMGSIAIQTFANTAPLAPTVTTTQSANVEQNSVGLVADPADNGQDGQDENAVLPTGGISEAQARAAITVVYPAVTIQRIELEDNNGTIVYGAKLSDKTEVTVDAKTGVVTQEAPDQEDVEHQDSGKLDTGAKEVNGAETNDAASSAAN